MRDPLVLGILYYGTICARKYRYLLAKTSLDLSDDEDSCPTSSRIQRVSDEYSWKHLSAKLMNTTFCLTLRWDYSRFQSHMLPLDHQMEFQIFFHTVTLFLPVCLEVMMVPYFHARLNHSRGTFPCKMITYRFLF